MKKIETYISNLEEKYLYGGAYRDMYGSIQKKVTPVHVRFISHSLNIGDVKYNENGASVERLKIEAGRIYRYNGEKVIIRNSDEGVDAIYTSREIGGREHIHSSGKAHTKYSFVCLVSDSKIDLWEGLIR